jgi:pimeloyl-ACP methyl ester carboxylesterase
VVKSGKRGWRYWIRLVVPALMWGVLLFSIGYVQVLADACARPIPSSLAGSTPADLGFAYEEATLLGEDGLKLRGWYIPSQNGAAVILLHGYGGNRLETLGVAGMLARHGYGTLMYDLRATGESEGDQRTWGWRDVYDVPGAVAYLKGRDDVDPDRIGVIGFSRGAEIAIIAAARSDDIRAVVAEDPYCPTVRDYPPVQGAVEGLNRLFTALLLQFIEWNTGVSDPIALSEVIRDISPRPLLLLSTGRDIEKRVAAHYYALASDPKAHWNIPEAGHGGGSQARPGAYEKRIVAFFEEALLGGQRGQ